VYGTLHEEIQIPCPDRLTVLRELIDEATAKVIIFAPFKCTLHMLKPWLDEFRTVGVIDGTVAKKDRDLIFQQFQNRQHGMDTLLAQPGTMAHGLTLTAADMIIWYAPVDSNEIYEQANGRFTRPDQQAQPIIAHIEASPADRVIYNRLKNKQGFQNIVLEMLRTEMGVDYEEERTAWPLQQPAAHADL
jgi:superfamily II DNA or RNA helicase